MRCDLEGQKNEDWNNEHKLTVPPAGHVHALYFAPTSPPTIHLVRGTTVSGSLDKWTPRTVKILTDKSFPQWILVVNLQLRAC